MCVCVSGGWNPKKKNQWRSLDNLPKNPRKTFRRENQKKGTSTKLISSRPLRAFRPAAAGESISTGCPARRIRLRESLAFGQRFRLIFDCKYTSQKVIRCLLLPVIRLRLWRLFDIKQSVMGSLCCCERLQAAESCWKLLKSYLPQPGDIFIDWWSISMQLTARLNNRNPYHVHHFFFSISLFLSVCVSLSLSSFSI